MNGRLVKAPAEGAYIGILQHRRERRKEVTYNSLGMQNDSVARFNNVIYFDLRGVDADECK